MKQQKILVFSKHIELGIAKYKGQKDERIQRYIDNSPLVYTVYRFADERILLVYENNLYALLYANEQVLMAELEEQYQEGI